jgi:hypothetical protein
MSTLADGAPSTLKPQQQKPLDDLNRCLTPLDPNHTFLIGVIEMSQGS